MRMVEIKNPMKCLEVLVEDMKQTVLETQQKYPAAVFSFDVDLEKDTSRIGHLQITYRRARARQDTCQIYEYRLINASTIEKNISILDGFKRIDLINL